MKEVAWRLVMIGCWFPSIVSNPTISSALWSISIWIVPSEPMRGFTFSSRPMSWNVKLVRRPSPELDPV